MCRKGIKTTNRNLLLYNSTSADKSQASCHCTDCAPKRWNAPIFQASLGTTSQWLGGFFDDYSYDEIWKNKNILTNSDENSVDVLRTN